MSMECNLQWFCSFSLLVEKKNVSQPPLPQSTSGLGLLDWAELEISLCWFCYLVGPRVSRWDHKPLSSRHVLLLFLQTQHAASEDVVCLQITKRSYLLWHKSSLNVWWTLSAQLQTLGPDACAAVKFLCQTDVVQGVKLHAHWANFMLMFSV